MLRRQFFATMGTLGLGCMVPKEELCKQIDLQRPGIIEEYKTHSEYGYFLNYLPDTPESEKEPKCWYVKVVFDNGRVIHSRWNKEGHVESSYYSGYPEDAEFGTTSTEYDVAAFYGVMYYHPAYCNHKDLNLNMVKDGVCEACGTVVDKKLDDPRPGAVKDWKRNYGSFWNDEAGQLWKGWIIDVEFDNGRTYRARCQSRLDNGCDTCCIRTHLPVELNLPQETYNTEVMVTEHLAIQHLHPSFCDHKHEGKDMLVGIDEGTGKCVICGKVVQTIEG